MVRGITQELKDRWIQALSDGSYNKGTGTLRRHDDEFCCLGVLCDLIDNSTWDEVNGSNIQAWSNDHGYYKAYPPTDMFPNSITKYLADLNDRTNTWDEVTQAINILVETDENGYDVQESELVSERS